MLGLFVFAVLAFEFVFSFVFLVSFIFVLPFVIACVHVKFRIYETMNGKSHDMSFCVGVQIRQWNSSAAHKTYPQDVGIGRC